MSFSLAGLLARALESPAPSSPTEEKILDGALGELAAYGVRRTTMDGVARRSGVGRVTVFRQFGTKDALVERLVLRELRRFLAEVDASLDPAKDPDERIVDAFVACLAAGRDHPLVVRLARNDPGAAMELLARGDPSPMEVGRRFVAGHLKAAAGRGDAVTAQPDAVADVLVRLAASYVLFPPSVFAGDDEAAARAFARRTLAPMAR